MVSKEVVVKNGTGLKDKIYKSLEILFNLIYNNKS